MLECWKGCGNREQFERSWVIQEKNLRGIILNSIAKNGAKGDLIVN